MVLDVSSWQETLKTTVLCLQHAAPATMLQKAGWGAWEHKCFPTMYPHGAWEHKYLATMYPKGARRAENKVRFSNHAEK